MSDQRCVHRKDGSTHVKDMKDPIEVRLPRSDHVFIAVRMENARNGISFVQFDDPILDLRQSPAIKNIVNEVETVSISAGSTHVFNCSIASNTGRLN